MQTVVFQHALALFLWPQWLFMLPKKLRLVLAFSGVVSWVALRMNWRDGAIRSDDLEASFAHTGGNVPFQYQNRSVKCMHRISSIQCSLVVNMVA